MSRFLQSRLQTLQAYVPGEQPQDMTYVKLNTNESPYPPSPGVLQAVNETLASQLPRYPDPQNTALKRAIASLYDLSPQHICVTNGSDEALYFAFFAFGEHGVAFPDITYGFYTVFSSLLGLHAQEIPLEADFTLDPGAYVHLGKMIVIANPNAPTGLCLSVDTLCHVLEENRDHVVVIDEAYVDFGAQSMAPLVERYDNLLVVQTCSKSRCLAGARLGFALGHPALIQDLERIRYSTNPYNINRMTSAAGLAAIQDNAYYTRRCEQIVQTRQQTAQALRALGFEVTDSRANFLFAQSDAISGKDLYEALKARGVLIRHFTSPRIANYNRITVGSAEQMECFLKHTREILQEVQR